ncbi:hypothetical protein [Haliangium sp.]|uniref:hypothetical protein n=1 Tax=Haliangium sp. TaxID=2663208 RepID=UPI003D0C5715
MNENQSSKQPKKRIKIKEIEIKELDPSEIEHAKGGLEYEWRRAQSGQTSSVVR